MKVKELISMLESDGWRQVRQRGSHRQFKHDTKPGTVAGKPNIDMPPGTLNNALYLQRTMTWSCYEGGDIHCGRCGTCVERREAFRDAGVEDPTEYQDRDFAFAALAEGA
jgi:predicted RNA binding protein YcfA (HicA-like mRNA interferase family)